MSATLTNDGRQESTQDTTPEPWWPVALLLVIGLALRIPALNAGPWYDEIQTQLEYVRLPWRTLLTTFDSTNQHYFYSISAHLVQSIAGESTATLRIPAVIFGVLSLWAALSFGRRWMPAREAWWSAALLAVSYHHVWFSQNARGYTALLLGTLVSSSCFLDLLRGRKDNRKSMVGYAVVMALTILTHVSALVVVAAHGLCWLWRVRSLSADVRWAPFKALVMSGVVTVVLYAPVFPQMFGTVTNADKAAPPPVAVEWQRPAWFLGETIRALMTGIPAGAIVVPIAGIVGLIGLSMAFRRDRVATVLMLLPLVMMAALVLLTGHNLWPRFFFFGAAFLVQLAVRGGFGVLELVAGRRAELIGNAGLAVTMLMFLYVLPRAWQPKQDYQGAVEWVVERAAPGDVIAITDLTRRPVRDWLGKPWPLVNLPEELQKLEAGAPRTWVLYAFPIRMASEHPELWQDLSARYTRMHEIPSTVGGGEIVILSRAVSSPTP